MPSMAAPPPLYGSRDGGREVEAQGAQAGQQSWGENRAVLTRLCVLHSVSCFSVTGAHAWRSGKSQAEVGSDRGPDTSWRCSSWTQFCRRLHGVNAGPTGERLSQARRRHFRRSCKGAAGPAHHHPWQA